jgi:hypothetical protein
MYGLHMYRAVATDRYMKATAFTDPRVVELITDNFVPLRMCCDEETGKALNLKPFDFVEPGFHLSDARGKIVHKIRPHPHVQLRLVPAALVAVLRRIPSTSTQPADGKTREEGRFLAFTSVREPGRP